MGGEEKREEGGEGKEEIESKEGEVDAWGRRGGEVKRGGRGNLGRRGEGREEGERGERKGRGIGEGGMMKGRIMQRLVIPLAIQHITTTAIKQAIAAAIATTIAPMTRI